MKKVSFFLIFISLLTYSSIAIANDSTSIFKVSIGFNHTRYKTKGNYNHSTLSHFGSSDSTFNYHDTASYSPSIIISLEEHLNENLGFLLSLGYTRTKLSFSHSSSGGSYNPYPPYTSYYSSNKTSFTASPNNFLLALGLKINLRNFYFCPNIKITYSFSKAIVTDTSTSGTYSSQITNITTNKKENYSFGGPGAGLLLGYEFDTNPFPLYIEARADYSSVKQGQFNIFSWDICLGIKFRKSKNLKNPANFE